MPGRNIWHPTRVYSDIAPVFAGLPVVAAPPVG